jgi:LysR family hydrogen peroxide-inducible transcriptional activator
MELAQIRYVVAVAGTGNFTRAAAAMGISQPSLSQQIINLERELGHKLFHRLGRKAVLTEAGSAFAERARRILSEVDDAVRQIGDNPTFERRIAVGAIPTLAPYVLPDLIERCRSRHPNLQVNIREDFRTPLLRSVIDGELDFALVAMPVREPILQAEILWQEKLVLVVGKAHRLVGLPRVTAEDLREETFILLGSSSSLAAQVRQFCGDHHFEPKIGSRCAQVATVKALVAIGAGISILPEGAEAAADRDTLAYIALADAEPVREIAVLRHMQRYQSRGAEQFLALIRERPGTAAAPPT